MVGDEAVSQLPPNDALKALEEVLGNEATREIVRLYLKDFPDALRRVSGAGREDQMRLVHGLKSSSLHMGATDLSDRLASLEEKLGARREPLEQDEIASAVADFGAVAPTLRAYAGA
jgi:hypothetical protein